jgi:predicted neutral ceramidase superfamily lipid hydrolase
MAFESTLACMTTGSFSDLQCILGHGFLGLFGNYAVALIFSMLAWIFISRKFNLSFDFTLIGGLTLVFFLTFLVAPQWMFFAFALILLTIAGWGYYKWGRR